MIPRVSSTVLRASVRPASRLGLTSSRPADAMVLRSVTAAPGSAGAVAANHKMMMVSGAALLAAVPATLVSPFLADLLLAAAIPPHILVGTSHIIEDYAPQLPHVLIARIVALLVLVALLRMAFGPGIVKGFLGKLWADE